MSASLLIVFVMVYVGLLFAIAYWGDRRAAAGRSIINNPYVYTLSLAVYCTAWTFYGSVGRAASSGVGFLPIYLGPTLLALLWITLLRKIIRISKQNRITTIADFISSRYGKSTLMSGLVTVIAVFGTVPYLSLQLKAVTNSLAVILGEGHGVSFSDGGLVIAMVLAAFSILFGTRSLDATEHHAGLVLTIAFESIVKLVAFLAVGFYVTFVLFPDPGTIFEGAQSQPDLARLMTFGGDGSNFGDWFAMLVLSMLAIFLLPRQFQMAVVENTDEKYLTKASWLFPLYLLLINLFVLPIAFAGRLLLPDADADFYVLSLPLYGGQPGLAILTFIGGVSSAAGMVIVATVALSTMIANDLIMPVLLRLRRLQLTEYNALNKLLLTIRRIAIVSVLLLSYAYLNVSRGLPLVSIGLVSFAACAQFAPALIGGIYWKRGTRTGALAGLLAGFMLWAYTLPLPSLVTFGGLPEAFITHGAFGWSMLRPYALFGVEGIDPITHGLLWSLTANTIFYVVGSLLTGQSILERTQATRFVDVFERSEELDRFSLWHSTSYEAIESLLRRFLGAERIEAELPTLKALRNNDDATFINYAEKLLASAIGAASAHILINKVVVQTNLTLDQVMSMLDEASQVLRYSRQLEIQSEELNRKTAELRDANERLRELDTMKDDFVSTVTHELRTPLTSIRAFTEILYDNPALDPAQRSEFLGIIQGETERLTRLINNVLDLSKIESGNAQWLVTEVDMLDVVGESLAATRQLFTERCIEPVVELPETVPVLRADHDRLVQVMLNLLSNAIKFSDPADGCVCVRVRSAADEIVVSVVDNGRGIPPDEVEAVFTKFRQAPSNAGQHAGTGLGLPISKHIVEHFGGRLWVESVPGHGATFRFALPLGVTIYDR